jgi:predicted nucleotidyltransferase
VDRTTQRYAESVARIAAEVLGTRLVGVYVHGSAALGGFDPARSDVDVLVVSERALSHRQKVALARSLSEAALPCPAKGLELSVVTQETALRPSAEPGYELHLTTAPDDAKVVDGRGRDGDPDLVLHFAVCVAAGQLVGSGLPIHEAFGVVAPGLIAAQLVHELQWAAQCVPDEYAVLNACRAWKFTEDGSLVSKIEGGEWARATSPSREDRALIGRALELQRNRGTAALDAGTVRRFVRAVTQRMTR